MSFRLLGAIACLGFLVPALGSLPSLAHASEPPDSTKGSIHEYATGTSVEAVKHSSGDSPSDVLGLLKLLQEATTDETRNGIQLLLSQKISLQQSYLQDASKILQDLKRIDPKNKAEAQRLIRRLGRVQVKVSELTNGAPPPPLKEVKIDEAQLARMSEFKKQRQKETTVAIDAARVKKDSDSSGQPSNQLYFAAPEGMEISIDAKGRGTFERHEEPVPTRRDFKAGATYRLKVSNLPGRPGVDMFPTIEIPAISPKTGTLLQHNAIPICFSEEDLDEVLCGNLVTKVIFVPEQKLRSNAPPGVETFIATKLDSKKDPVFEASQRGTIVAIIRIGNRELSPNASPEKKESGESVVPVRSGKE